MRHAAAAVILALSLAACGGAQQRTGGDDDDYEFDCKDRRASYVMIGGFVAPEYGVVVQCSESGPELVKWTSEVGGERDQRSHRMSGADFDEVWQQFEDAGWRNVGDCLNTKAADDDQVYTFEVADHASQSSFVCQGKQLPFPHDRLVNALDVAAGKYN